MAERRRAHRAGGARRPPGRGPGPGALAGALALVVLAVTVWARAPVGAGVYYDDGVYLALARSLADGEGYRYANLPGAPAGVKYPPLYPLTLAAGLKIFGPYPASLGALKGLNALLWAGAAALTFLLFGRGGGRWRRVAVAGAAVFGFLAVPSLSVATALLSEPLFLLLAGAALLAAERARAADPEGTGVGRHALAGILAAAALLARLVGVTVVAAVALAPLMDRRRPRAARWRAAGAASLPGLAALAGWGLWSSGAAPRVPEVAAGQYGAYAAWYLGNGGGDPLRPLEVAVAGLPAALESLRLLWAPQAPLAATLIVLAVLGGCAVYGARVAWRRSPALPLFVLLYLGMVFSWPYEPDRFLWTIGPFLTLLAVEGIAAALPALRADLPRAGPPLAGAALVLLVLHIARFAVLGYANRAWEVLQRQRAAATAPLVRWVRDQAPPDAVVASHLDPYMYWGSGRLAVPSWRFTAGDYGHFQRDSAVLASDLEAIRAAFDPDYLAVVRGDTKAWLTAEAYAARHPEELEPVFETEETVGEEGGGVVYRFRDVGEPAGAELTPPTRR